MTPLTPTTLAAPATPASALTPTGVTAPGTPTALTGSTLAAPTAPASALTGGSVSAPATPAAALTGGTLAAPATPAAFGVVFAVKGFPTLTLDDPDFNGFFSFADGEATGISETNTVCSFVWNAAESRWEGDNGVAPATPQTFWGTGGDARGPWTATAWFNAEEDPPEAIPAAIVEPPPGVVAPSIPASALTAPGVAAPASPAFGLIVPGIFFAGTLLHKGQALAHLGDFLLHNPL